MKVIKFFKIFLPVFLLKGRYVSFFLFFSITILCKAQIYISDSSTITIKDAIIYCKKTDSIYKISFSEKTQLTKSLPNHPNSNKAKISYKKKKKDIVIKNKSNIVTSFLSKNKTNLKLLYSEYEATLCRLHHINAIKKNFYFQIKKLNRKEIINSIINVSSPKYGFLHLYRLRPPPLV